MTRRLYTLNTRTHTQTHVRACHDSRALFKRNTRDKGARLRRDIRLLSFSTKKQKNGKKNEKEIKKKWWCITSHFRIGCQLSFVCSVRTPVKHGVRSFPVFYVFFLEILGKETHNITLCETAFFCYEKRISIMLPSTSHHAYHCGFSTPLAGARFIPFFLFRFPFKKKGRRETKTTSSPILARRLAFLFLLFFFFVHNNQKTIRKSVFRETSSTGSYPVVSPL